MLGTFLFGSLYCIELEKQKIVSHPNKEKNINFNYETYFKFSDTKKECT